MQKRIETCFTSQSWVGSVANESKDVELGWGGVSSTFFLSYCGINELGHNLNKMSFPKGRKGSIIQT